MARELRASILLVVVAVLAAGCATSEEQVSLNVEGPSEQPVQLSLDGQAAVAFTVEHTGAEDVDASAPAANVSLALPDSNFTLELDTISLSPGETARVQAWLEAPENFEGNATLDAVATHDEDDRTLAETSFEVHRPDGEPAVSVELGSSSLKTVAGSPGQVQATLSALGDASTSVVLETPNEGFTLNDRQAPHAVEPDQPKPPAAATLTPDAELSGDHRVRVNAVDNATGVVHTTATLEVGVAPLDPVELSLDAAAPAALPGSNVTLEGTAENPVAGGQSVTLSLTGVEGTLEPSTLEVEANGTATTTVTAQIPDTASGSVTVGLSAVNQANRTSTAEAAVPVLAEGEFAAGAVQEEVGILPGQSYAVPVLVVSNLGSPAEVSASGENVVEADLSTVQAGAATGGFVTLETPEGASEAFTETVTVTVGEASQTLDLKVDPAPPGEEAEAGKQVSVEYVGRLADNGRVFDSSRPAVAEGPFPKAEQFQARGNLQPLEIPLNPQRPGVVQGFYDALVNMTENETRTVTIEPGEAYGPVRTHENRSATTELEREQEIQRNVSDIPTQQLPPEFNISEKEEGDEITYTTEQGGETITFRFELTRKGEQTVDLLRLAEEGETTTFYPPWPNATEVVQVNETHILYQTTPPDDIGNFTWDVNPNSHEAKWENATSVESVNETAIVLRHSPEEGLVYNASSGPRSPPSAYTVESVGDEEIHVSTPNDHPLAGETLVFDITMLDVSEFQRRGPMIGGGGPG